MPWSLSYGWYHCESCDRDFRQYHDLMQHLHKSFLHNYCEDCNRDFSSNRGLIQHYTQSPRHAYCQTCDEHFDDSDERDEHMDECHWWCSDCDLVFTNNLGLHEHRRQSHADRYCIECKKMFRNRGSLHSHSAIHRPKTIRCLMRGCIKLFASHVDVVLHLESGTCVSGVTRHMIDQYALRHDVNNLITNPRRMITGGSSRYTPPPTYTATNRAWNGHRWECYFCSAEFQHKEQLNQHLASPKHSASENKIYKCPNSECARPFSTLSGLGQHIENGQCGVQRFRAVRNAIDNMMSGMKSLTV